MQASLQRSFTAASGEPRFSVAVLGAAGGIGQPLALLLKGHPAVGELRLYDVVGTAGVGVDIGHINTQSKASRSLRPCHRASMLAAETTERVHRILHICSSQLAPCTFCGS
jgi:N-acetyl-gamma-glutamylphosphate reductase